MKVNVLIVEDELLIASHLKMVLEELGYAPFEPVYSKEDAFRILESTTPDIAILDIHLASENDGIEIAEKIRSTFKIPFIFLTSNSDKATVQEAKKTNPSAFLVKPFTEDELYAAIEVAMSNFSLNSEKNTELNQIQALGNSLFVKQGSRFVKVPISSITDIQVEDKYIDLFTNDLVKYTVRSSMDAMLDTLIPYSFLRVHRSHAINLHYLQEINGDVVKVHEKEIPIGRTFRDDLLSRINTF